MEKFLIIDGNSIMNRAFYGLSNFRMFSKTAGIHTNALYAFLNIYWMILEKINPDYIAVSFDLKAPTFRHKMYSEYKATRKGMPDELAEQMPMIKEILNAMNVPIIEIEGYEADDVLGTVAKINSTNGIFTYILTGDKDSFQLISDDTSIIIPTTRMGKTEYTIYTPELLKEKQNIEPYQIVDIKSLMGDSSDNIPGVRGIGEKTAYSLIWKYTTLENIYNNIENLEITAKVKEKLVNDKEIAFLSKKLATIDINVPINFDYKDAMYTDVNKEKLFCLFKKLEFTKFLEKYDFSGVENIQENSNSFLSEKLYKEFKSSKEIILLNSDNLSDNLKYIYETFNEPQISYILNVVDDEVFNINLGIQKSFLAIYSSIKDTIYIINIDDIKNNCYNGYIDMLSAFSSSSCEKIGYNIKQDIRYILNSRINNINNFSYDVMIAYYLMDSLRANYDLEYILNDLYELVLERADSKKAENIQLSLFPQEISSEFLTKTEIENITISLKGIFKSKDIILKKLEELDMLDLFNQIEMPLTETLASMEHFGMYIDKEKLEEFDVDITNKLSFLEKNIYELAGNVFNINSPQQLGHILFEVLNLPVVKKKKTGFSTDKEVLEELADKHEIINLILEYRQTMKLKTTYVDGLKNKIASDGRIHTTFMQTVTSTGRLSSIEPNLQNIPIKLELGRKIRSFFVAQNDNEIVDADYSQIELRVLSHMSNDQKMINAFNQDIDIHKVTASEVFGIPIEDVTYELRSKAKAVNFGIVYGISEFGLAKNISSSRKEAGEYINNYLEKYSGINNFMEESVNIASNDGYAKTLFGRRRYINELSSKNKMKVQFGKRVAMNTPIQGTAADIIKLAMNKIYYTLKEKNLSSHLIMQVHDELIIEAVPQELEIVKKIMKDTMENIVNLRVPLKVDLNVGKSWYDAK